MSILERIIPGRRGRRHLIAMTDETRAVRDSIVENVAGMARAMEERFAAVCERIDAESAARAMALADLGERIDEAERSLGAAIEETRAALEGRLGDLAVAIDATRKGQDFAGVLRDLKRDLAAQISLGAHDAAADGREIIARFEHLFGEGSVAEPRQPAVPQSPMAPAATM